MEKLSRYCSCLGSCHLLRAADKELNVDTVLLEDLLVNLSKPGFFRYLLLIHGELKCPVKNTKRKNIAKQRRVATDLGHQ